MKVLTKEPLSFELEEDLFLPEERMDISYFNPDYLVLINQINKSKNNPDFQVLPLGDVANISDGDHGKRTFVELEPKVRYLRAQDIINFEIISLGPVFISENDFQKLKRSHIQKGDILLTIMGTVGNVAYNQNIGKLTANRTIAIIRVKLKDLKNEYLAEYLDSIFMKSLIKRNAKGSVQKRINLSDLANLPIIIPKPNIQEKTINLMEKARENKKQNLIEVENLRKNFNNFFVSELGLEYPDGKNENIFEKFLYIRFRWAFRPTLLSS